MLRAARHLKRRLGFNFRPQILCAIGGQNHIDFRRGAGDSG